MSEKIIDTHHVREVYNNPLMIAYYTDAVNEMGILKSEAYLFQKNLNCEDRILDIGCGAGRVTIALHDMGYRNIVGIDIAGGMIEKAVSLCENIEFAVGDATDLQFDDETFDGAIFSFNGLMLIPGSDRRLTALKEINRVLKKKGILILSTPYLDNKLESQFWRLEKARWKNNKQDERLYEFGDLLLEDFGIEDIYIHIPKISEIEECLKIVGFVGVEHSRRLDICLEEDSIEDQLDDGLFWIAEKSS